MENEDKRLAWFPAPYLELWEGEEDDDDDEAGFQLGGMIFTFCGHSSIMFCKTTCTNTG